MVLDRCVDNFFAETEQAAFCTNNIVPGVDFSNDPLLQGRNFSYLDTQLKRLGGPNFTQIPINAPKCPFATLQQDGHMAIINPKNRVNYEPNSRTDEETGPREDPDGSFHSYLAEEEGRKVRVRPESFADHYSQARQFYISQTPVEQNHIVDSFTFELSKVENSKIRQRMVSQLMNVDDELAERVAKELGLEQLPQAAKPARPTRSDLEPSPALSILHNGPDSFEGRKVGALVTEGVESSLLGALKKALDKEGAVLEIIAPTIEGIRASDGAWVEANQKIDGGPSVLYDAVALLVAKEGIDPLKDNSAARDFVADAFAHSKFIAYSAAGKPFLSATLGEDKLDKGFIELRENKDVGNFVQECRKLRFWERPTGA
jgi:catalase